MDRPTIATPMAARPQRRPLPDGAAAWSRLYIDHRGEPVTSAFPVPVDEHDHRTDHIRVACFAVPDCPRDAWILPGEKAQFCPDHGAPLTAMKEERPPALPWSDLWQAAEKPLRPFWVLAAEAAAGIGMHQAGLPTLDGLLAGGAATAAAYYGTSRYLTKRAIRRGHIEKGQTTGRRAVTIQRRARTAAYAGVTATAWLTAATSADPTTLLGRIVWASLPVAWAVSAAPWWRSLEAERNRPEPVVVAPAPVADVEPTDDAKAAAEAAKTWAEHVGFANTYLDETTWKRTIAGWQAVVTGKRGSLVSLTDVERMKSTIAKIAAGYGVKRDAITWLVEHDGDPNKALLLIQPNNPLKDGQIWGGPETIDMEKGAAEIGRLIDGSPMIKRIFIPGWGAPSGLGIGTTGGGKSVHARRDLVIERWASYPNPLTGGRKGAFISMLHDPKRLESYAEFRRALHAYGTTVDDGFIIGRALLREAYRRYDTMGMRLWTDTKGREREGGLAWDPRIHGPIISAYWDEFHILAKNREFVAIIEELARIQRACGMRAEIMTHMSTIGDTGSQALRDLLAGGRATMFRTTSGLNAVLATGGTLVGDPRGLPKDPGMCYVADGETAAMMGRESWIPSDDTKFEHTLYDYLFDENNEPIGYPAEIPDETKAAFGTEFMEWAEAGKKPGGRDVKVSPSAAFLRPIPSGVPANATAETVLRHILLDAPKPMTRGEITADLRWTFGVSTMTNVFRAGQDATPPWLIRHPEGKGTFELTAAAREQMSAAADEEREELAA